MTRGASPLFAFQELIFRMNTYVFFSDDYLSEHLSHEGRDHLSSKSGRGSGRYPWGSGKNPRQNTAADMRRAKRTKRQADRIKARRAKKEKEAEDAAKRAQEAAAKQEEQKNRAINSGDPDEVKRYSRMMTNNELEYALDRINKTKKLNELSPNEVNKLTAAEKKVTEFMKHVDTVTDWMKTINNAYTQFNNATKNYNDIRNKTFGAKTIESKDDKSKKKESS